MVKKVDTPKYLILRDSKEKDGHGWWFITSEYYSGTKKTNLKTGDYTLEGFEDLLCIERKGTLGEFAQNIVQKRFYRELERMKSFKYKYLILEFDVSEVLDYPRSTTIPKFKWKYLKFNGEFILRKIIELQYEYGITVLMCGKQGKQVANRIFRFVTTTESKLKNV